MTKVSEKAAGRSVIVKYELTEAEYDTMWADFSNIDRWMSELENIKNVFRSRFGMYERDADGNQYLCFALEVMGRR